MGDEMLFLNVPYAEKDQAKALGARWDAALKKWYVPAGVLATPFECWMPVGAYIAGLGATSRANMACTVDRKTKIAPQAAPALSMTKGAIKSRKKKAAIRERLGMNYPDQVVGTDGDIVGRITVGANYIELAHDCSPFEVCEQCKPVLIASGWIAARESVLPAVAAL